MAERARRPPTGSAGRPRRFVLPEEEDARTIEAIEGFLVGGRPRRRGPSPAVLALRGRGSGLVPPDPLAALEPRLEWLAALAREEVRHTRYRRPVTVALLELRIGVGHGAARPPAPLVRRFVELARRETRTSDRITRLGPARFAVLLPETTEVQATHCIERLRAGVATLSDGQPGLVLRAGWASPRRGETLRDAATRAEERLGAASPGAGIDTL